MTETWYVMEDGEPGDPLLIAHDKDGKLRHADGRAVAYAPHGPRSRGVDADAERAKVVKPKATLVSPVAVADDAEVASENREIVPSVAKRTYKTRGALAE